MSEEQDSQTNLSELFKKAIRMSENLSRSPSDYYAKCSEHLVEAESCLNRNNRMNHGY